MHGSPDEVTFGIMVPWHQGAAAGLEVARAAEAEGFHSVWCGDHLVWYVPFPDPIAILGALAVATQRVQLGVGVLLATLRPPVLVAKQLASVDWLSGGRLIAGMGIGGENPAEFLAAGVPVGERSGRLDETIAICRSLWAGQPVEHRGRRLAVSSPPLDLAPVDGSIPVWVGGRRPLSLRRAGRLGDGWLAFVVTPERYAENLAEVRGHAEAAGRDPRKLRPGLLIWCQLDDDADRARADMAAPMEAFYRTPFDKFARFCLFGDPAEFAAGLQGYIDAGVRHFNLSFTTGDRITQMRRFRTEVLPRLRLPALA